ncbi:MAG: C4-dicarboxylate ABC transporter, partial [Pseudomonadales bacterium]|nr:C4-dicarboxylate ABC transporter [Pseudomonadales bacterium]
MNELTIESSTEKKSTISERLPVIAILFLLIFIIFARTGESFHGQITQLGTYIWEDYFVLRADIANPTCDPNINIQERLNQLEAEAASSADDFDLFDEGFDRTAAQTSLENQVRLCQQEHLQIEEYRSKVTPAVEIFSAVEHKFSEISIFSTEKQQILLLALLFISAAVATMKRHHIGFRPMVAKLDFQVSLTLQLIANTALAVSAWKFRINMMGYDVQSNNPEMVNGMAIGATVLALLALKDMFSMPKDAPSGGTIGRALLSVPLYTIVMLLFAFIVIVNQNNLAGLSLYFSAFFDHSGTYIDVALYLWCGMLLKQTQVGERVFSLFTPWRLPPEILAFVAIVIMALPTAYTGASSIIILAMGAVVYRELRKVGTRRQLALAATAMSGSSGIVLKPCLIVIIVSILNKEVVSDDLFYWGVRVFLLTVLIFFIYAMITRKDPLKIAPMGEALPKSLSHARPLFAYLV